MKRILVLIVAAWMLPACNNSETAANDDTKALDTKVASASEAKMDYAYTVVHPDQWEWGSKENTKMVLESLKGYETGDMDAAVKNFADTIELRFDGWEARLPRDSVKATFKHNQAQNKAYQILMDDFESVKSKDDSTEYVSMWYKQKWQDLKGKWDSLSVMDDVKIKNGKIISIDEKTRHYAAKKM